MITISKKLSKEFSKKEELANSITHGIGLLLSIVALVLLIVYSSSLLNKWVLGVSIVYGITMILLYTSSTLLHSLPKGKAKNVFEILDHSAIYFYIAGSYTPVLLLVIQDTLGWILLVVLWGLAIGGTIFKIFFVKRFVALSTFLYVMMGWIIVFAWNPLVETLPKEAMYLLIASGLFYTLGSVLYVWRGFRYHHAIWHLFVLGGSAAYFLFVLKHLILTK